MNIYQGSIKDMDAIAELFNLYRIFYEQPSDLEGAKVFIKERFANKDSVIFLAVRDEEYVGFTQLYPTYSSVSMKRVWILNDLYVKEEARKYGIGKGLLDAAKEYAKETDGKGILLETALTNVKAQNLYEKYGYEKVTSSYYYFLSTNK